MKRKAGERVDKEQSKSVSDRPDLHDASSREKPRSSRPREKNRVVIAESLSALTGSTLEPLWTATAEKRAVLHMLLLLLQVLTRTTIAFLGIGALVSNWGREYYAWTHQSERVCGMDNRKSWMTVGKRYQQPMIVQRKHEHRVQEQLAGKRVARRTGAAWTMAKEKSVASAHAPAKKEFASDRR
eukprot:6239158-Amphidinium_carterae.1